MSTANAADFLDRLRKIDCCAVSDALDQLRLPGVVSGLAQVSGTTRVGLAGRPCASKMRIAGRAITVKLGVGTASSGPPKHLCATAIEIGGPGDIIVIEQRSGVEAGSWGGLLSLGARVKGIAGVIAEGPVRDIDQAIELGFPVFARSFTARTARGRIVELATNVPVAIGDLLVEPGCYVLADRSGVIFIRPDDIERVLIAAARIAAKEEAMAKAILAGQPIGTVMGGDYEHMLS